VLRLNPRDGQVCLLDGRAPEKSPAAAREISLAIDRAKRGDRDAVRILYVRYSETVYRYVRSIVRDEKDAEDITQLVFMRLMTVIGRYEDRGVPFSAWLLRVARNAALDHLRRRRVILTEEPTGIEGSVEDDRSDRARDLRSALDGLPAEQRNVVVMRHVIGLTPPEIAERMGRSESSIHGLHHRGRRALRKELLRMQAGPATFAAGG